MTFPAGGYVSKDAAIADGLIHNWPMDETTGAVVSDAIGTLHGEAFGPNIPLSIVSARMGNGRQFDEVQRINSVVMVSTENPAAPSFANWSVSLWVQPWANNVSRYFVSMTQDAAHLMSIGRPTSATINMNLRAGAATLSFNLPVNAAPLNGWAHVVVTCNSADRVDIYVNGTLQSFSYTLPVLTFGSGLLRFGSNDSFGSPIQIANATLDECAIWGRTLTLAEVGNLYNGGVGTVAFTDAPSAAFTVDSTLSGMSGEMLFFADWTAALDPVQTSIYYACELTGAENSLSDLRLPISSWQATVQNGRADYVQAVVPAAEEYLDAIAARPDGRIKIHRGARFANGTGRELELTSVPLQAAYLSIGPRRRTIVLSGYGAVTTSINPSVRHLEGVRSVSVQSGTLRARSAIDWLLRPGMVAHAAGYEIQCDYINYYVSGNDAYMDVGERG